MYVTCLGFTADMSFMASPGRSNVLIIPGGMMAPSTSRALSPRLTENPGTTIPEISRKPVTPASAASCGRVASPPIAWPPIPRPGFDIPPRSMPSIAGFAAWSEWSAAAPPRSVIKPCLTFFFTIQTLNGYAVAKPTITPTDITPQKASSSGSIARMSRPIIRKVMVGAMPAIIAFMLMNSGMKLLRTFSQ